MALAAASAGHPVGGPARNVRPIRLPARADLHRGHRDTGIIIGTLVLAAGLALSVASGIGAVALNRRQRPIHEIRPLSSENPRRPAFIVAAGGLITDALGDALPEGFNWDGLGPCCSWHWGSR